MQRMKQLTASTLLALVSLSCAATANDKEAKAGNRVEARASMDMDRPSDPSWANGLSTEQIKDLQRELQERGLYQGEIDGSPGRKTEAALRNFQIQNKLEDSHGLDARTRDALDLWERQPVSGAQNDPIVVQRTVGSDTSISASAPAGTPGAQFRFNQLSKEQTKTLQSRLRGMGFYRGEVDGVIGDGTRAALEQYFRTQADLAAQGIVSDATIGLFASCQ